LCVLVYPVLLCDYIKISILGFSNFTCSTGNLIFSLFLLYSCTVVAWTYRMFHFISITSQLNLFRYYFICTRLLLAGIKKQKYMYLYHVILHELTESSSKCFKFHYLVSQSMLLDTYLLFLPKKIFVSICGVLIFLYQTVDLH
jgi:hypothetical protein